MRTVAVTTLLALSTVACVGASRSPTETGVVAEVRHVGIPVQPGDFQGVAWTEPTAVVVRLGGEGGPDGSLSSVDLESGAITPIDVSTSADCRKRELSAPVGIGPSEVAAADTCYPPSGGRIRTIILADLESAEIVSLGRVDRIVRSISLYPDRKTAILSLGNQICQGIAELINGRVVPITMDIVTLEGTFNLSDEMRRGDNDCDSTGRADSPALSPNGNLLAFFASAGSAGKSGTGRLDASWDLILRQGAEEPRSVLAGVDEPFEARWDPTGRWLAFGADIGGLQGTWLFDATTDRVQRLSDTTARGLSWAPDGRSIAVLEATSDLGSDGIPLRSLSILDLTALLTK